MALGTVECCFCRRELGQLVSRAIFILGNSQRQAEAVGYLCKQCRENGVTVEIKPQTKVELRIGE